MFRITKVFENDKTAIYKIEGRILEEAVETWIQELQGLLEQNQRQIILDLGQVWYLCRSGIEPLIRKDVNKFYLLNCSMEIKNTLVAAGCSSITLG
jgi:anti-anti-sigma regulatory factor